MGDIMVVLIGIYVAVIGIHMFERDWLKISSCFVMITHVNIILTHLHDNVEEGN